MILDSVIFPLYLCTKAPSKPPKSPSQFSKSPRCVRPAQYRPTPAASASAADRAVGPWPAAQAACDGTWETLALAL